MAFTKGSLTNPTHSAGADEPVASCCAGGLWPSTRAYLGAHWRHQQKEGTEGMTVTFSKKSLFKQIRTHLTNELMASLTPTGLIESHYSEVQRAKKSIVDRYRVNKAIAKAQGWLNDYPIAIQEKKKELAASINQVRHQHRQINDIPGSDEQDMQLIADVDQICLRVVEAIEKFL
uniref:Uncharacterized protein n=1 Tax=Setaria italica TaxID=4555 RepID=K3ZNG4_SETIT